MRAVLLLFLTAALPASVAQAQEPLVSNRPGFSNVWEIVEPGRVELNAGLQYDRVEEDEAFSIGQVLVRVGVSDRLELRVGLNSYVELSSPAGDASGLQDPSLGLKWKLFDGSGEVGWGRPEAALIVQSSVPVGSDEFGADDAQSAAILVLSWDPGCRYHLDTNHGLTYLDVGDDRATEFFASYALGIALVGDLAAYLEYAAFVNVDGASENSSFVFAAITHLPSPHMQLDIGVGRGLNSVDPDHFVTAGVAYRW